MTATPLPALPPEDFVWFDPEHGDMPLAYSGVAMQAYAIAARADLEAENHRLREALEQIKATKPLARAMKSEWCPAATGMVRVASAALKGNNHD